MVTTFMVQKDHRWSICKFRSGTGADDTTVWIVTKSQDTIQSVLQHTIPDGVFVVTVPQRQFTPPMQHRSLTGILVPQ